MSAPIDENLVERLRQAADPDGALDLLRRAIGCESITGDEQGFADLLARELQLTGVESVTKRDFEPGRPNVWGVRKGRADGMNLLLIGHTDTVHVRGWREHWQGTEREDPFGAALVDGAIWGRGASDLKAGICTAISAVRLLDRSGIRIDPTLTFGFVGDEESGEPGSGVSAGVRAFAEMIKSGEISKPDFAIYVEPTMLDVYVAHMGFFIGEITVFGRSAYFGVPELGVDALRAAAPVLEALWQVSEGMGKGRKHPLVGHGFVLVTGLNGGGYIAVPGECRISYICKILPGDDLEAAKDGIEAAVRAAITHPEISLSFEYPAMRDHPIGGTPFESIGGEETIERLVSAVQAVRPGRGRIEAAPYWSEQPFLASLGIPGVYFAPGDIRICHTLHENVIVEDYLDGIVALAAFLATCSPPAR